MDHSQDTVLSLEERIHAWKQKIEAHFEVINTLDLRDEGLLQTVTTLITNVGNLLAEVSQIERRENQEEVARYVRSIGALRVTLSHTLFALHAVDQTLKDMYPLSLLPLLERGVAIRLVHKHCYDCWSCLKEARYYATAREKAAGVSARRDHSPSSATTLEERMRVCKQKIEKYLLVTKRLSLRDRDLLQTVGSLVTNVGDLLAEVSQIERTESREEVARYVSMGALLPLLYNTVLELQIADFLLKEIQPLLSSYIEDSVVETMRTAIRCCMNCWEYLSEAVRAFKEETIVEGSSGL